MQYTALGTYNKAFVEFDEISCIICLEDFENKEVDLGPIRKIFKCGHMFHSKCLEDWVLRHLDAPKCPLCNQTFFDE